MDHRENVVGGRSELARGGETPAAGVSHRQGVGVVALSIASTESLSMERIARFFDLAVAPQGNALVGEMVDENGPLAGRESARAKPRSGGIDRQFSDGPVLFAPNDAPDELPDQPSELDRLLQRQEFRQRRRFGA